MKLLLMMLIGCLTSVSCYCCSCIGEISIRKELKRSDMIFIGQVLSKKELSITDSLMPAISIKQTQYLFLVKGFYKGKCIGDTVSVVTGIGGGDCGYKFTIGSDYLIYSSYQNKYYADGEPVEKFLYTDVCRRTKLLDIKEKEGIEKYKKLRRPKSCSVRAGSHAGARVPRVQLI